MCGYIKHRFFQTSSLANTNIHRGVEAKRTALSPNTRVYGGFCIRLQTTESNYDVQESHAPVTPTLRLPSITETLANRVRL